MARILKDYSSVALKPEDLDGKIDFAMIFGRPGTIRIATNHADYFQQIEKLLAAQGGKLKKIEFLLTPGADKDEWVGINFERKYLKENRPIYTIAIRKI